ncbi:energy-coupled thiamine transporter ThiT [Sporomusa acidovorans]|uniref:Thiamine transporter ThiT n=1 Tax=Sporomusa acidovorans (strain ATCC 49682 / DSM 3132 / Mol) TaxID=1123286 RepID=A0ABZ3J6H1_SPOA4|nr:energy-coupled thiamine transporter ThiT [Sporomusa acidovorans]OZC21040.1 thiamine transporter ThiT [Sporomusa acidovorans DSM 3132]SDF17706.1 thiamine transporter [Sporomusa acidovorans]
MKGNLVDNLSMIAANPTTLLTLGGVILLVIALLRMKKVTFNARMMAHIGLALALAVILHTLKLYHMPQGGSITLGGMIPILLIAFFYGPEAGFLTGFLFGVINLIQDPYILHPVQVLFDYPLPFMALGLAGYFKDRYLVGTVVAIIGRFIFHYISGIVFFASYAPSGVSPYLYSLLFNASYLSVECIVCVVIMRMLPVERIEMTIRRQAQRSHNFKDNKI